MKIYKEVLIESAEQAEALPVGTTATNAETTRSGTWHAPPRVNIGRGMWSGDDLYRSADMVGWTALVPVEAEEEWTPMVDGHAYVNGKKSEAHVRATVAEWPGAATGHRLVTPWEEA